MSKDRPTREDRLRELLLTSGIPFELSVALACRQWASNACEASEYRLRSERVLYASTVEQDQPLREIDQVVSVYSEFPAGEFSAQMIVSAAIECKRREGIQVVGCAIDNAARAPGILHGQLAWLRELPPLEHLWPSALLRPESFPVIVEEESRVGLRQSKEQLIQNAALAAVDYVVGTMDLAGPRQSTAILAEWGVDAALEAGRVRSTLDELWVARWLHENRDHWIRRIAPTISPNMHYALELALPVVCVDAPLFEVDVSAAAELGELRETPLLVTSVRPKGWPLRVRPAAPRVASYAPVIVTNREGLVQHVLPALVTAAQALQRAVAAGADTSAGDLFDATVRSSVLGGTERWTVDSFRSDVDPAHWAFIDGEHLRPLPW